MTGAVGGGLSVPCGAGGASVEVIEFFCSGPRFFEGRTMFQTAIEVCFQLGKNVDLFVAWIAEKSKKMGAMNRCGSERRQPAWRAAIPHMQESWSSIAVLTGETQSRI